MPADPYAAPKSHVADAPAVALGGDLIPQGQAVATGNGWQWIADGWGLFMRQPGTWVLIMVIFIVIFLVLGLIPIIGSLATNVLYPVFAGGFLLGCRALASGGDLEVGHLFAGFRDHFGKLALVGLFYLGAVIVAAMIAALVAGAGAGGFAALSNPEAFAREGGMMAIALFMLVMMALIVPAAMAIWFAPALIVFNDFGVGAALKSSFSACLKNIVPFLIYGIVFFVLAIVASIPIFLGWLALGPTLTASIYTAYRDIFYAD